MITLVISAYNEAENIAETIAELRTVLGTLNIASYEIIVVDDHSTDNTFAIVEAFADTAVKCIYLSKRMGSHTAERVGLRYAQGDAVICMSADGQDGPESIELLLAKCREGYNLVWALRKNRDEGLAQRFCAYVFYKVLFFLTRTSNVDIDLSKADFYLLDRKVVDAVNRCTELNTSLFGLLVWCGFKQGAIEYVRGRRRSGRSKWSFSSKVDLALNWIVAFSGIPLRLTAYVGSLVSLAGFIYAIYIVYVALSGHPVEGWASLMVVVLILGGMNLMVLGIVGHYLWANIEETRSRPLYFIEKRTFGDE
ncbi:dolichol-phosphate mannosyltransferase [Sinobacterium caligoides]|uniref:Dolichol-phosphate mannosyltransferase n=1 Tax=Sinobacterium caligoides TaxID=933926 RepID=A0A3N2DJX9_9GAMM|nr:glycosyltransferase family 2 protein [Sinobacterium caligoides]ROS00114.1 dolichol-phosphate mannosyltransferase [Sinobacterium caligoides]